ncbi:MAG: hypothetical protein ACXVQ0_00360 [Actinomycetota bacterium]
MHRPLGDDPQERRPDVAAARPPGSAPPASEATPERTAEASAEAGVVVVRVPTAFMRAVSAEALVRSFMSVVMHRCLTSFSTHRDIS